jgi:hypothetical protein
MFTLACSKTTSQNVSFFLASILFFSVYTLHDRQQQKEQQQTAFLFTTKLTRVQPECRPDLL